ncbi:sigma-70 family RNA polymerase sigma factor [Phytomonospora sp. NPDC050363]|uniref:sigma-70 family RNA polymerase sigma factor n=1 Tax=Phytomonospora sp. NPDC050363 TaxID=3155642 RepID=UPI0033D43CEB
MNDHDSLAASFEEHRPHLRAVAYRMLGSLSEAEDAVQEGWLRLSRADVSAVGNLGGWLTTVVGRICLDMLRTRKSRREEPLGEFSLPEPIVSRADGVDPEHEALLSDSVGIALLVVLDTLNPIERLAFVLHDMFGVSFEEIAPIVDRTIDATRQLSSRSRRRVQSAPTKPDPDLGRQRRVVDAFFAAAREGDFDRLVSILDPNIVLRVDGPIGRLVGAETVASRAAMFASGDRVAVPVLVNGVAGMLATLDGKPVSLMAFTVVGGKVAAIDALSDPARLAALDLSSLDA